MKYLTHLPRCAHVTFTAVTQSENGYIIAVDLNGDITIWDQDYKPKPKFSSDVRDVTEVISLSDEMAVLRSGNVIKAFNPLSSTMLEAKINIMQDDQAVTVEGIVPQSEKTFLVHGKLKSWKGLWSSSYCAIWDVSGKLVNDKNVKQVTGPYSEHVDKSLAEKYSAIKKHKTNLYQLAHCDFLGDGLAVSIHYDSLDNPYVLTWDFSEKTLKLLSEECASKAVRIGYEGMTKTFTEVAPTWMRHQSQNGTFILSTRFGELNVYQNFEVFAKAKKIREEIVGDEFFPKAVSEIVADYVGPRMMK